jgi:hypothetical protein
VAEIRCNRAGEFCLFRSLSLQLKLFSKPPGNNPCLLILSEIESSTANAWGFVLQILLKIFPLPYGLRQKRSEKEASA